MSIIGQPDVGKVLCKLNEMKGDGWGLAAIMLFYFQFLSVLMFALCMYIFTVH